MPRFQATLKMSKETWLATQTSLVDENSLLEKSPIGLLRESQLTDGPNPPPPHLNNESFRKGKDAIPTH